MSIQALPVELLLEIFSYQDDRTVALKNTRQAIRGLNDFCASHLFRTIIINLDDAKCVQFLLNHDSIGVHDKIQCQASSSITSMMTRSFETVSRYTTEINIIYLDIENEATEDIKRTTKQDHTKALSALSHKSIRPLLVICPYLRVINATLVDCVLNDASWIKFLTSICPEYEPEHNTRWSLRLCIDAPPISSRKNRPDEYSNLGKLYNLTAFELGSYNSQPTNKPRFVKALTRGLSSLVNNSPGLTRLSLHAGVGWNISMDDVLMPHASQNITLMLKELALQNVLSPQKPESIKVLRHLKSFVFADRHFNKLSDHPYHQDKVKIEKEETTKRDCTWQLLGQSEIWLSSLKSRTPCVGLIGYLAEARLPGTLTFVEFSGPFNSLTDHSDALAQHFWMAMRAHAQTLNSLKLEPSHYGDWCWKPATYTCLSSALAAAETISVMRNLKVLSICPADATRIMSGHVQKHPFVTELLASIGALPKLEKIELLLSVPQWIISPTCRPALRHQNIIRRFYSKAIEAMPDRRSNVHIVLSDVKYK